MTDQTYAYPFDPTGKAATNLVPPELHVLNPPTYKEYYYIVPKVGPFFQEGLVVTHYPSGLVLTEGVDFVLGHKFIDASKATGKSIWGSISFYNKELSGTVEITYQTLGGPWTINEQQLLVMLSNVLVNPRTTSWEQVIELPTNFPVIDHEWNLDDMVGASDVVDALDRLTAAILDGGSGGAGVGSHILDLDNPHQTNKHHVGLGNLSNFLFATLAQALETDNITNYVHPKNVHDIIANTIAVTLNEFIDRRDNPNQVTAEQVGLGNVPNIAMASLDQAVNELVADKLVSPALVAAIVESLVGTAFQDHINASNPHGTTKDDIGLDLIQNLAMAVDITPETMGRSDLYASPALIRLFVEASISTYNDVVQQNIADAVANSTGGTAEMSQDSERLEGLTLDQVVELVSGTVGIIIGEVQQSIDDFAARRDNPNQVTADQVGAITQEALDAAIDTLSNQLTAFIQRTDNPHQVTAAQTGAMTSGETTAAIQAAVDLLTQKDDAQDVEIAQIKDDLSAVNQQISDVQALVDGNSGEYVTKTQYDTDLNGILVSLDKELWKLQGGSIVTLSDVSGLFTGETIQSIASNNDNVYVMTDLGLKSIDSSLTATTVTTPITSDYSEVFYLESILFVTDTLGNVAYSINDGVTWETSLVLPDPVVDIKRLGTYWMIVTTGSVHKYTDAFAGTKVTDLTGNFVKSLVQDQYKAYVLTNTDLFYTGNALTSMVGLTVPTDPTYTDMYIDADYLYVINSDGLLATSDLDTLQTNTVPDYPLPFDYLQSSYNVRWNVEGVGVYYTNPEAWGSLSDIEEPVESVSLSNDILSIKTTNSLFVYFGNN